MNKVLMLKEQIYNYVQRTGPIIPIKVAKHFNSNTIFVSAILSELISGKKLKISKAKIGGTPVYYAPGQEEKLSGALRDYLKQYPRKALDLLEQHKVLRDPDCEPAIRVALRELKDFAKPLEVQVEGNNELFWKFHTLDDEKTKELINAILERIYKKEEKKADIIEKKEEPKTEQEQINEEIKEELQQPDPVEDPEEFEEPEEDIKEETSKAEPEEESEQSTLLKEEEKETLLDQDRPKPKEKDFEKTIISYLNRKNINILEKQTIKKNRELNFVVNIPSNVGDLMYFVKAKNKKKINEGELLLAFTEGQNLKLPTIYVTNAETTKKALTYREKNMKGLLYKKINF